ncbi:MAG: hypothetical protein CVV22_09220 [Ignavibacteriae bacterium HGW-Ignavibacteriae-1]|jgi:uncharacterized protein YqgV (UPF0045/DUF77 family)|nr:MAG: hypothetical protein CVV22_09220 [Ignavibacteriae bacterium HGW-Ignavibacteriae-1]
MKLTVDISLYPLSEDFIPFIKEFIIRLKSYENLTIATNKLSTQVSGEFDEVMKIISTEMKATLEEQRSVLVMKFLLGDKLND